MDKTQMIPPDDVNRTIAYQANNDSVDNNQTVIAGSQNSVSVNASPENVYANCDQNTIMRILLEITGTGSVSSARMPVNICLLLDRSASMDGPPIEYVKKACGYVVDLLQPNDILSIVAFTDDAEVIMPPRKVINSTIIKEHINSLQLGNTTNLYDGIKLASNQVASVNQSGFVNRVLLFTDGEPTAGKKDFSSIVGLVTEQKGRGITITALGFGIEYNEELLASISKTSGGNYYYISMPELIPEIFRKELESIMRIVGKNLSVSFKSSRWVQLRHVYGKSLPQNNKEMQVSLTDIEQGETMGLVLEYRLERRPLGKYRISKVNLNYDDVNTGETHQIEHDIVISFTDDATLIESGKDMRVSQAVAVAEESKVLEKTIMGLKTQQISKTEVIGQLQKTQRLFIDQGRTLQAQEIQQAINEINNGSGAEKTLIGTLIDLERGKSK